MNNLIVRKFIRPVIFIWVVMIALVGTAVGASYLLPSGNEMTYTKTFIGNRLAIRAIYLRDMSRNLEGRLTDLHSVNALPKWSPDGQQIVYLSPNDTVSQLYMMDAVGQNKRLLQFPFTSIDSSYVWSPDSQWVLVSGIVEGVQQSVVVHAATGKTFILPQAVQSGSWSSDSQAIVYQVASESGRQHFYGVNINCLVQVQQCEFKELPFLQNQDFYDNPIWSPDGHYLAFISNSGNQSNVVVATLRCADLVESCVEKYTVVKNNVFDWEPVWSADSKRLAYVISYTELGITQIETGENHTYTLAKGLVFLQNWSPDGQFIIYIVNPMALLGNNIDYVLDIQTGESTILSPNPRAIEFPEWRPVPH